MPLIGNGTSEKPVWVQGLDGGKALDYWELT